MFNSVAEVQEFIKEYDIKMVDFKMVDLEGRWRHLSIPVERFTEDTMVEGIGFDGSNYGYAPIEKSDMVFIPNLKTAIFDKFSEIPTITMMGDVFVIDEPENRPFDQYPRNVSLAAEKYMRDLGIADQMIVGPEFEFYLFDRVAYQVREESVFCEVDTKQAEWNSAMEDDIRNKGYQVGRKKGYHADIPQDITYNSRAKMCMTMEDWGIKVKYHHHEVGGPGQVEIEVELGEMTEMADAVMATKYIIKNTAVEDDRTATFLPKPIYDEAGSGLHVHMHLFKDGKPLFYDKNGYSGLSELALHFMGGILKHAKSLCAFTNPSTNSYKRLVPGFEAPVTIGFATANRSSVIRIPAYAKAPDKKRFELRNPDGTANPYYAFAAILMAGIDGVKNKINAMDGGWGPYDFNLYDLTDEQKKEIKALPRSLMDALDALKEDHDYLTAGGVFPQELIDLWIEKKKADYQKVHSIPHPAEFSLYYDL
ncbi:MAG: type I glutamate--ammonia ligase [Clostridiales bacterium]|nr:type I glutamate--ammonia ligase [Clostridiales bacterium]